MTVVEIPSITLPLTLSKIPAIAFGSGTVWKSPSRGAKVTEPVPLNEPLIESLTNAIEVGFRHIDTAEAYLTHAEVGEAIKRSGVERSELFVTDKYSASSFARTESSGPYQSAVTALKELGLDYLDLFLIHVPSIPVELQDKLTLKTMWKQMERLVQEGVVKNIGISNFTVENLQEIMDGCEIKPQIHQIEFHPYLQNQTPGIKKFNDDNGIVTAAFSPLVPLSRAKPGPLDDTVASLAAKYNRSEAQILLRWVYQSGVLPVTTSSQKERLQDALDMFQFELEEEDFNTVTELGKKKFFRAAIQGILGKYDEELQQELGLL
ncbi:hypothetical protein WICPIJ_000432 [Wickerhamomyces pijperi]|uniref:NADP-dependent oxidoreductase domain-containing protein n=1 Tax=Wickerhamomyces pijperi TaxID=599730 RepID=A0A9P8QDN4_WICPI|nr:hypothetical protein WICPIJ_000432 [Wickerhamomyces pijperi]